ncbi:MAG: hypothetical protein HC895_14835, partial [Leptolyngbyaceae cyanobacterium SM1_3_5]|nr:hypothetical protein [Leptolyngbyaceae cyanobacterium SM1_3_5]
MAEQNQNQPEQAIFRNRVVDKGQLRRLIAWAFTHYGTGSNRNHGRRTQKTWAS